MNCSDIQDMAEALLDGEHLSEHERTDVEDHIRTCDACRREYEMDSATRMLVRSRLSLVEAPAASYTTIRNILGEA